MNHCFSIFYGALHLSRGGLVPFALFSFSLYTSNLILLKYKLVMFLKHHFITAYKTTKEVLSEHYNKIYKEIKCVFLFFICNYFTK